VIGAYEESFNEPPLDVHRCGIDRGRREVCAALD
jgi:hypothetical protein